MEKFLSHFKKVQNKKHLKQFLCSLEKENLRITKEKKLSGKEHYYGSKLTHPFFTTDFAEMQVEMSTRLSKSHNQLMQSLKQHTYYLEKEAKKHGELLWPFSMPPELIQDCSFLIAKYPHCKEGNARRHYREELCKRYGSHLQMICGLHYNVSFQEEFFLSYAKFKEEKLTQSFKDNTYLHITRNFIRYQWVFAYLFGASPCFEKSYINIQDSTIKKIADDAFALKDATSIRLSSYGYQSAVQKEFYLCYNSLHSYTESLDQLLNFTHDSYLEHPNPYILQKENEDYSLIRLKRNINPQWQSLNEELKKQGIEYLEIRAIDLQPHALYGIEKHDLDFIYMFLLLMLALPSPELSKDELIHCRENLEKVALFGKNSQTMVNILGKKYFIESKLKNLFQELEPIAKLLGASYHTSFSYQFEKLMNKDLLPSSRILNLISDRFINIGYQIGIAAQNTILKEKLPVQHLDVLRETSLNLEQELIKEQKLERSTQVLIQEARKHKIEVEILDVDENIISLKKGKHLQYIKQATKTEKDSYVSPLLMENKQVSKTLLQKSGLSVPKGVLYPTIDHALDNYPLYKNANIVIKPNTTNFGIGVHILSSPTVDSYKEALSESFSHKSSVLIEKQFMGKEYRFLVINKKVLGIIEREPSFVIGDGKRSIELIFFHKMKRRLHPIEIGVIQSQGYVPSDVAAKDTKVYMRKNSNVSTGGIAIDRTDDVHSSYNKIAIKAALAVKANICGVDIMIEDIKSSAHPNSYNIIEVNFNPVIYFHQYPHIGKSRNVAKELLKFLGFINEKNY